VGFLPTCLALAHLGRAVDPLITELVNGAIGAEEADVRDSYAVALGKVILSGGKNISPAVKPSIVNFIEDNFALPSQKGQLHT
jgi:hypothetical protein